MGLPLFLLLVWWLYLSYNLFYYSLVYLYFCCWYWWLYLSFSFHLSTSLYAASRCLLTPSYEGFARCSLHITHALPEVLPFTKLQEIAAGDVYIANNDNLCFVSNVNFENIFTGNGQIAHVEINNNKCGKWCSPMMKSIH